MRKALIIIFTIIVCGVFAAWDLIAPPNQQIIIKSNEIFPSAPEISLTDLEGNAHTLSALNDKTILLNFWATWCPPCVKEMPDLIALAQQEEMVFIAASVDRDPAVITKFFDKIHDGALPPNMIIAHDPKMLAAGAFETTKFPESFIINQDGLIVKKVTGVTDWHSDGIKSFFKE